MEDLAQYLLGGPVWIIAGVVLIVLEFVIPGAVVIFFGGGAILTGALTLAGVLPDLKTQLLTWVLSSLFLVLLFRRKIGQWFPAFERYDPRPEPVEMLGRRVTVLEDILPDSNGGRVRFQGATWQAATTGGPIYAGGDAKIVGRKNLLLIVEPYHPVSEQRLSDSGAGDSGNSSGPDPYA
jgi:membrane protein implicated in regulation of membrane protease activity